VAVHKSAQSAKSAGNSVPFTDQKDLKGTDSLDKPAQPGHYPAMRTKGSAEVMTPAQFIAKWSPVTLSERAASREHFIDLDSKKEIPDGSFPNEHGVAV